MATSLSWMNFFVSVADTEDDDINIGASTKILFDNFIVSLKNCVNRELVDRVSTTESALTGSCLQKGRT